jgi:glycosyltransferase involved in cell wall biosynthesis
MSIWAFPAIYPFDRPGFRWKGIFAHRQYKGLIENGADVKVVIPVPWHPVFPFSHLHSDWTYLSKMNYPAVRQYDGITVYHPRIYNMRPNRFVKKSYEERETNAIVNFFRENNIILDPEKDIFYSQWTPNSVIVQKAARILGVRSAILCIGDDVVVVPYEKPEYYEQFRSTWIEADMRFVVSDYLGKEANKVAKANMPYDVVFMGVEHNIFKPVARDEAMAIRKEYDIPADKQVILSIGTASLRKGWIELFDALVELKKKTTDFFLVGIYTGIKEFDFAKETEQRGLSSFVLGLDGVPPDSLHKFYNAADIFCLPSHSEGMANVVIEAMSSGLPVITTDVGGQNEIVHSGENGVLIPPLQPQAITDKLLLLINDKKLKESLGTAARTFIVNHWGTFKDMSKGLYSKLCRPTSKIRIWAFPSFYPYDKPGLLWMGIFAHRQYKGLIENGADLKVMEPIPGYPPYPFYLMHEQWKKYGEIDYPKKRTHEGVEVFHPRIYNIRPNRLTRKPYEERYFDAIVKFFKRNNIVLDPARDIFYSQWVPNSVLVQQVAHRLGIKSAVLGIGDDIILYPHMKSEYFKLFKKTWEEADHRFVVADYLGREANKLLEKPLPYDVIFMGVDYNYFKPGTPDDALKVKQEYKIPTDKTIILTVGTAIIRKGWLDLFDALMEIKKINSNFIQLAVHAGDSELNLAEEVTKRGLNDNFIDIGEVYPNRLNKLFNAADIFCLPSHWEGMANVVIEAMSSGLPVITTDVAGHPEIVESGVNGILIPAKQPEILGKELSALINNKGKRELLGKNARDFIVNKWGNFTDNTRPLYAKLCAMVKSSAPKQ